MTNKTKLIHVKMSNSISHLYLLGHRLISNLFGGEFVMCGFTINADGKGRLRVRGKSMIVYFNPVLRHSKMKSKTKIN